MPNRSEHARPADTVGPVCFYSLQLYCAKLLLGLAISGFKSNINYGSISILAGIAERRHQENQSTNYVVLALSSKNRLCSLRT